MFEALLKILPLTASAFQWLLAQDTKEREEFASLCQRISESLERVAQDPERLSRNLCAELRVYVPEIKLMANGVLKDNQLMDMANQLENVCDAWKKHSENVGKNSYTSDSFLGEVQEAEGHFKGLANLIRRDFD